MAEKKKKRSVSILFENILYFIKNDTSLLNKLLNKFFFSFQTNGVQLDVRSTIIDSTPTTAVFIVIKTKPEKLFYLKMNIYV